MHFASLKPALAKHDHHLWYAWKIHKCVIPPWVVVRTGKVVASHAEVARSIPGWVEAAPIYTIHEGLRGYCTWGWGCDQSILFTVSDAIVRSWFWSTATRSSPLSYFSRLLRVVDNFCGSRFSTWKLLAIENITFFPFIYNCLQFSPSTPPTSSAGSWVVSRGCDQQQQQQQRTPTPDSSHGGPVMFSMCAVTADPDVLDYGT